MELFWSPVVATCGNRPQQQKARKPRNQAQTLAVDCEPLPATFDVGVVPWPGVIVQLDDELVKSCAATTG
jgi:hypothetical protein